jgi:hypothetical protein
LSVRDITYKSFLKNFKIKDLRYYYNART